MIKYSSVKPNIVRTGLFAGVAGVALFAYQPAAAQEACTPDFVNGFVCDSPDGDTDVDLGLIDVGGAGDGFYDNLDEKIDELTPTEAEAAAQQAILDAANVAADDAAAAGQELGRNNPLARRITRNWGNHGVGKGITLDMTGGTASKMKKIMLDWDIWAESTDCDFEGHNNLYGLQWLWLTTVAESGAVFIRQHVNNKLDFLSFNTLKSEEFCVLFYIRIFIFNGFQQKW